jgi:hypothetical protein
MEEQPAELLVESVNPTYEFIRDAPMVGKRQRKQFGLNSSFGRNGLCCCFETMMDILLN